MPKPTDINTLRALFFSDFGLLEAKPQKARTFYYSGREWDLVLQRVDDSKSVAWAFSQAQLGANSDPIILTNRVKQLQMCLAIMAINKIPLWQWASIIPKAEDLTPHVSMGVQQEAAAAFSHMLDEHLTIADFISSVFQEYSRLFPDSGLVVGNGTPDYTDFVCQDCGFVLSLEDEIIPQLEEVLHDTQGVYCPSCAEVSLPQREEDRLGNPQSRLLALLPARVTIDQTISGDES